MPTREEFEARPEWRATLKRRDSLVFILEGAGKLNGSYYEYPHDWVSRPHMPVESEIHGTTIRRQLETGQLELVKGALPKALEINAKIKPVKNGRY
jgi:hypothetical protein